MAPRRPPPSHIDPAALTPAQITRILEEQAALDPLSPHFELGAGHYRPSPNQMAFHRSNAYYKLVLGGGRTGKTTGCLVDLSWAVRGIHPFKPWNGPFTSLLFAITRQQAAMVMSRKLLEACELPSLVTGPRGEPMYPDIGQKPLIPEWEIADLGTLKTGFRSTYWIKLTNGCELWFSWSDIEDTWKRIQGPKIGYVYLDENAGNKALIIEARKRLQDSQKPGDWRGCLVWGAHGTENNDAFDDFKDLCERRHPDHELFRLNSNETGAVDAAATKRFASVLTKEEQAIHITAEGSAGDLVRVFGQQWNDDLLRPREVAAEDNLWVSYDPGVDHPMGMLVDVIRKGSNTVHCVQAWCRRGGTIADDVADLAAWLDGRTVAGFVYDTNLRNRDRGGGPTVLDQFKELCRQKGVQVAGWWQSKKNHAPGINLMRQMMVTKNLLIAPDPGGSSGNGMAILVSQLRKYRGRESTKFTGPGGVVKKDDELVDCLRYRVMVGAVWRPEWTCGARRSAPAALDGDLDVVQGVDAEGNPLTFNPADVDPVHARLVELSRLAGQLRSGRGGGRRVRSMHAELWRARTHDGQSVAVPAWLRG